MASLIRHCSKLQCLRSTGASFLIPKNPIEITVRTIKLKTRRTKVLVRKFEWDGESLAARGFLRPIKSYKPPVDLGEKLEKICQNEEISSEDSTKFDDPVQRFNVLVAAAKAFKYSLPNSRLHEIETIGDLREFYSTPIDATVPFDALTSRTDLPENLHILHNYHRFHPDEDTKFGGKTAFPGSSTFVTGLKYKKKYKGHIQREPYIYK